MIAQQRSVVQPPRTGKRTPEQQAYADRCSYWSELAGEEEGGKMYRRRTVIIGGYGTVLRVRHDALEMFPGIASARDLVNRVPVRLDRGVHGIEQVIIFQESRGSVSLDALSWLQEQGI